VGTDETSATDQPSDSPLLEPAVDHSFDEGPRDETVPAPATTRVEDNTPDSRDTQPYGA